MTKKSTLFLFFFTVTLLLCAKHASAQTTVSQISSQAIDQQLQKISQRLQDKKIQDALSMTLKLKQQSPNDIKTREMLFDIYIQKKLIDLAEKELLFLEARNQNIQTLYRRAIWLRWKNKIKESILLVKKILEQNKNFVQAHLFLADLLRMQKLFEQARNQLQMYQSKNGKTRDFLLMGAKIEIDQIKNQNLSPQNNLNTFLHRLEKNLQDYADTFGQDSEYYATKARYYFLVKKYEKALKNIEKVLFLQPNDESLKKQKIKTLFYQKDIFSLIDFLESMKKPWTDKNDQKKYLYLLGFLHLHKEKIKGKDWEIADKEYLLSKIIPPLLRAHQIEPEDEKIQFFIESLLKKNLKLSHPLRLKFAKKHLKKAQFFLDAGEKTKARYAFLRALRLSPQEPAIRKTYLEWLKKEKQHKALLDEMMIVQKLTGGAFLQDYKNETLLELLKNKEKQTLMYQNDIHPEMIASEEKNKLLLLYRDISWEKQFSFPYHHIIVRDLLREKLSYSHLMRINVALEPKKEIELSQVKYDYYLDARVTEKKDQLKIFIALHDAHSQQIKGQKMFFYGQNERFFQLSADVALFIEKILPKKGKILKINNDNVIFSLGKIHGVTKNDVFEIKTEEKVLGPFPIIAIEEKISLGKITDYWLLSQIKRNHLVIAKKKKTAPKK